MKMSEEDFIALFNKFDKTWVGSEQHVYEYQKRYTACFSGDSEVVEIACGQGAFLRACKEAGLKATGIDLDKENVKVCKKKGYNAIECDAFDYLDENTDKIGGIFMAHLIEHFDATSAIKLIVSCYEALQQGGRLVIITPDFAKTYDESFWLSSSHIRPYPIKFLVNVLEITGFKIVDAGFDPQGGDTVVVGEKL